MHGASIFLQDPYPFDFFFWIGTALTATASGEFFVALIEIALFQKVFIFILCPGQALTQVSEKGGSSRIFP